MVYTVKVAAVKKRGRPPKVAGQTKSVEARILDSASDLFYKDGLRATGIDRVLSKAGAAKASLYTHYRSKDELVAAYLERLTQDWRARVQERVAPEDGRAGLLRLFDLLGEFVNSKDFRGCPFLNGTSELADSSHPGRAITRRHREWLHGLVRGLVSAAGTTDLDRVSRAVIVLHDGALASAVLDGDPGAVTAARFAVEHLLDVGARSSRGGA